MNTLERFTQLMEIAETRLNSEFGPLLEKQSKSKRHIWANSGGLEFILLEREGQCCMLTWSLSYRRIDWDNDIARCRLVWNWMHATGKNSAEGFYDAVQEEETKTKTKKTKAEKEPCPSTAIG